MPSFSIRTIALLIVSALVVVMVLATCAVVSRRDASERAVEGKVTSAQASAAGTASAVSDGQNQAETASRETEAKNREEILNAPNASETAGDAGNRGLLALCQRVQYQSDPRCVGLR